jgi:hypothetical protein
MNLAVGKTCHYTEWSIKAFIIKYISQEQGGEEVLHPECHGPHTKSPQADTLAEFTNKNPLQL